MATAAFRSIAAAWVLMLSAPGTAPAQAQASDATTFVPDPKAGPIREIAIGQTLSADFGENSTLYGAIYPRTVFTFVGRKGQNVTITAESSDAHTSFWLARDRIGVRLVGLSGLDKRDTDFDSSFSAVLPKDGRYYLVVTGHESNEQGVGKRTKLVRSGAFKVTLIDPTRPAGAAIAGADGGAGGGIESNYARLCATGGSGDTETCSVLRQAMLAKLSGAPATTAAPTAGASTATATPAPAPAPVSKVTAGAAVADAMAAAAMASPAKARLTTVAAAPNAAAWGPLARVGGTEWVSTNGNVRSYRWVVPGEILEGTYSSARRQVIERMTLDPAGTGISTAYTIDGKAYHSRVSIPRPGIVVREDIAGKWRQIDRYTGDVMVGQDETLSNGVLVPKGDTINSRRISQAEAQAALAVLAERRDEAQQAAAAIPGQWGLLAQLAGQSYLSTSAKYPEYNSVMTYSWTDPGKELAMDTVYVATGKNAGRILFTRDQATGGIVQKYRFDISDVILTADGGMRVRQRKHYQEGVVHNEYRIAGNNLINENYYERSGQRRYPSSNSFPRVTGQSLEVLRAATQRQQQASAQAAQAAAQQKAKKKSGGGLFGTLMAVGGAAAAVEAFGGNSEQMIGAVAKGIAVANPGSQTAGALASATDGMLTGGGIGGALAGAATGGAGGGAGYSARPNLAAGGACPGFTEGNYQSRAFEGGGDTQLFSMCGQAFALYAQYKGAIAQGYSEADANRTYAAHQQAAAVATSFYANNRAN